MFIVLRKKIVKRYLILALSMIFIGCMLTMNSVAQASPVNANTESIYEILTIDEMHSEGFNNSELRSMGFVNGIGKIIVYNAKQKQIWNARVEKARERVEVARRTGKKPNPRDLYLLDRDEEIKNPPKQPLGKKLFGQFGVQSYAWIKDYFRGSGGSSPDAKIITGEGLTLGGLLLLLKTLAPLAI